MYCDAYPNHVGGSIMVSVTGTDNPIAAPDSSAAQTTAAGMLEQNAASDAPAAQQGNAVPMDLDDISSPIRKRDTN